MHCTGGGNCAQGRRDCETPEACGAEVVGGTYWPLLAEVKPHIAPESEPMSDFAEAIVQGAAWTFAIVCLACAAAAIFY